MEQKNAKKVSVIVMDPRNGELLAMVNAPEFDLNDPFTPDQNLKSQSLKEEAAAGRRHGAPGPAECHVEKYLHQ